MITILAGILAIIFSTTRTYLTMRERRDMERARTLEQRIKTVSQIQTGKTSVELNELLDEKQLIYYRLKMYEKTKRMALMMSILLLVVSATFLILLIMSKK
jgi:hypothetical protein